MSVVFLALNSTASAAYLCIADMATGYSFDANKKKWEETSFNVSGRRYILKQEGSQWVWSKFGDHFKFRCGDFAKDEIECAFSRQSYLFNNKTLRYQGIYTTGYVQGREGRDTPHIEIGTCSPL